MSLGQAWSAEMAGTATQDEVFKYLDKYWESGGNFLDTSNNYQNGEVEDSLKKLNTSYVDLLYVHWWDYSTSIPELMQGLDSLVKANKVLYLGISDTPAWIVVKANEYARAHGMAQFVVYQGMWNVGARDIEREIVPMCRAEGMGIAPWGVLGQGKFKSEEEIKARSHLRYGLPQTEEEKKLSAVLNKIAADVGGGATIASIAVAWTLAKCPYVFPVIGGKSEKQLDEAIKASPQIRPRLRSICLSAGY
ncbi:hypothetical protein BN946_scf184917.g13 [Trametes cinnabarina]|uniref:NADP-dependent oxidoreductase domain-containing protein n=1 Tax=Pycnoporus cinnabarinus TaxID=5643 RepID=A0A060SP67_PYCCI|nr:hypothetical protein BN946_scf184917.g13 [Trametes cinnabarina]